jgi:hypothetical protein
MDEANAEVDQDLLLAMQLQAMEEEEAKKQAGGGGGSGSLYDELRKAQVRDTSGLGRPLSPPDPALLLLEIIALCSARSIWVWYIRD